ncbi:hypothetical protein VTG60DRAFT_2095 [Thermothelomyces hinnuleus]
MTKSIEIVSPVSDKLDWECQQLKNKFPRPRNDIGVPIPKPQECLLLIDGEVVKSTQNAAEVQSPIITHDHPDEHIVIGRFEMASEQQAMQALEAAERAYIHIPANTSTAS